MAHQCGGAEAEVKSDVSVEVSETLTARLLHLSHQVLEDVQGHQLLLLIPQVLLQQAGSLEHPGNVRRLRAAYNTNTKIHTHQRVKIRKKTQDLHRFKTKRG